MERQTEHSIRYESLQAQDNIFLLKSITVVRQAGHRIRDEKLQIQDSILLLKIIIVAR